MVTEKVISICLCGWIQRERRSFFCLIVNTDSLSTFRGEFQFGLITLLDKGLEIPFGIHTANNLFTAILLSTSDGAMNTASIFKTTVGSLISILPPLLIVLSISATLFFAWLYKWDFRRLFLNYQVAKE